VSSACLLWCGAVFDGVGLGVRDVFLVELVRASGGRGLERKGYLRVAV
jgi:hypothetical protein